MQFSRISLKPTKSGKGTKRTCIPPFWGIVSVKKWSPFFCFGIRSPIFEHLKTGTFAKSARFQVPKSGTSDAETKKWRPLFNANIPPKWWNRHLFYAFITFGWVLSQFLHFAFFGQFWSHFPSLTAKKLKVPFYNRRWPQIKKCKKTN